MKIYSIKLSEYSGLVQGIEYNEGRCLQYEYRDDSSKAVTERRRYLESFNIDPQQVVLQNQQHTANITVVTQEDRGQGVFSKQTAIKDNDGLITADSDVYLGVFTADCVPVSFYDPQQKIVGIAHSGWQGTVKDIAGKMVAQMIKQFDSAPEDIIVYLGPSIGSCCYEVSRAKDDRVAKFNAEFGDQVVKKKGEKIYLDLWRAVELQLEQVGILPENIETSKICTCCSKEYKLPSYYRDSKRGNVGTILSVIGRRAQ
ncbi:MAG: peptidoglycan editing factor PgeF [Parcubacteria group bacterium]|nr:peptidoglycan editing factor PgeF [Parcubacteria group bacterium]